MYDLVGNPEDRFSHFMVLVVSVAEQAGLNPQPSHIHLKQIFSQQAQRILKVQTVY